MYAAVVRSTRQQISEAVSFQQTCSIIALHKSAIVVHGFAIRLTVY